jgi:putative oxidoreductase
MFFADAGWQWKPACYAPLPLRLVVGDGFMAHAYAKLVKGPDVCVAIVQAIGVPEPFFMAWLTILIELLGGFAVLLAAFTVHLPFGFTSIKLIAIKSSGPQFGPPGYETDLLYLACLAALVMGRSVRQGSRDWRCRRVPTRAHGGRHAR